MSPECDGHDLRFTPDDVLSRVFGNVVDNGDVVVYSVPDAEGDPPDPHTHHPFTD